MSNVFVRSAWSARRLVNTPPATMATTKLPTNHLASVPRNCRISPLASARADTATSRPLHVELGAINGSSCSSHARMPVSPTASTIAFVERRAASYLTWSLCWMTSADRSSMPRNGRRRRSRIVASSPQHSPSMRKTDSACTSQRVHKGTAAAAVALIARGPARYGRSTASRRARPVRLPPARGADLAETT